jgi:hypothetical protein
MPWTVPCYLAELDSVRKSPEEIEAGQRALCACLLDPRNYVVISMNQLIDGCTLIELFLDDEHGHDVMRLVELGRIRVNRFGKCRTVVDYLKNQFGRDAKEPDQSKGFVFSALDKTMAGAEALSFDEWHRVYEVMDGALTSNEVGAFDNDPTLGFLDEDARARLSGYLSAILKVSLVPTLYTDQVEETRVPFNRLVPEAAAVLEARPDALSRAAAERLRAAFAASGEADNRSAVYRQLGTGPADDLAHQAADVAYCHSVESGIAGLRFSRERFLRDVAAAADEAGRPPRAPDPGPKPSWGTALRVSEFALGWGRPFVQHRGLFRKWLLASEALAAFRVLVFLVLFAILSAAFGWLFDLDRIGLWAGDPPGVGWSLFVSVLSAAVSSMAAERLERFAGSPSYARFRERFANLLGDAAALRRGSTGASLWTPRPVPGMPRSVSRSLSLARGSLGPAARAVKRAAGLLGRAARRQGL